MLHRGGQASGQSTPRQFAAAAAAPGQQQDGIATTTVSPGGTPGHAAPPAADSEQPPRPGTVEQVHWLLATYNLRPAAHIATLKQCSSSLFVLICSRLMNSPLQGIILQPDTYQKKMTNIRVVLSAMESILGKRLEYISAHEIVLLNETHIGYLVALFVEVAMHVIQVEEEQRRREAEGLPPADGHMIVEGHGVVPHTTPTMSMDLRHQYHQQPQQEQQQHLEDPELSEVRPDTEQGSQDFDQEEYGSDAASGASEPYDVLIQRWKQDLVQPPQEVAITHIRGGMQRCSELMSNFYATYEKIDQAGAARKARRVTGREAAIHSQHHGVAAAGGAKTQTGPTVQDTRTPAGQGGKRPAVSSAQNHVPQHRPRVAGRVEYVNGLPRGKRHHTGFDVMVNLPSPLKSVTAMGTGSGAALPGAGNGVATQGQQAEPRMSRDDKIAKLKNQRLVNEAQQEIDSGLRAQHSLAEAAMLGFGRAVQKQRRRDLADLKQFAKDDDELQRTAYKNVIAARKQKLLNKAWLANEELYFDPPTSTVVARRSHADVSLIGTEGHISDSRPTDTVLAAKKALAEYAVINQADMVAEYQAYRGNLSDWKNSVRV